ncbi:DUF4424 domain-containing protein [Neorhizobium galegae]|uniref:DUF4424 domain-containing protein n=1 Tax=Neorhizobium galegae TaxID=399 RepID=A0A6A1TM44_NEOGA|nr:DUF4424 domain-containing protein [Neorhizobium galegae]KAB1085499.1 DUF4424 domain-containing protein [Neorhizobium galegae]
MRGRMLIVGLLAFAPPAFANDSMAELKTGGLIYVQTSDVTMAEEQLYISREEVLVDYVFKNASDKDVESVIAFPMPDITGSMDSNIALDDTDSDNFLGFSVVQDSRQIKPELQQRVLAAGIDRTDELVARNIPLLPYSDRTLAALKALPEDVKAAWIAEGLVFVNRYDAGKGWQEDLTPAWTLRSVYWWKTKFPAGKPVRVSHRYKPSVGGTVAMTFIDQGKPATNYKDYADRYCIDAAFMKTAAKLEAAAGKGGPNYTEQWVSYILTTGANWGGSIGKFKLTIDKGREKDYLSFCGNGVKKIGPTTFEMTADDFYPEKDLNILFLTAADQ